MAVPAVTFASRYEMLHSSKMVPQNHRRRQGDLVLFGDGHVTLYFSWHVVLQAP